VKHLAVLFRQRRNFREQAALVIGLGCQAMWRCGFFREPRIRLPIAHRIERHLSRLPALEPIETRS
jgi:hypothetical protein